MIILQEGVRQQLEHSSCALSSLAEKQCMTLQTLPFGRRAQFQVWQHMKDIFTPGNQILTWVYEYVIRYRRWEQQYAILDSRNIHWCLFTSSCKQIYSINFFNSSQEWKHIYLNQDCYSKTNTTYIYDLSNQCVSFLHIWLPDIHIHYIHMTIQSLLR